MNKLVLISALALLCLSSCKMNEELDPNFDDDVRYTTLSSATKVKKAPANEELLIFELDSAKLKYKKDKKWFRRR
ncbi:hypothetical protein [Pontibacter rugosus]|uniref:Lipoprotein n=1 Tax=Pontibacter rugosus TaxID=1745966 RepID=A0ABW3SLH1_9BACT